MALQVRAAKLIYRGREENMNEYALVVNDDLREIKFFENKPPDIPHKGIRWFAVIRQDGDEDSTTIENDNVVITKKVVVPPPPPPPPTRVRTYTVVRRIEAKGKEAIDKAVAALSANPVAQMRFLTSIDIAYNDEMATAIVTALGLDPVEILAPEY